MSKERVFVLISPKNRTAYNFRGELIRKIIEQGYSVYVTGPNHIEVDKIEQLGAKFVHIPNDKNGINVLADLRYIIKLYRLMRRVKATATLGYTIKPVIYGAMAARLAGVKSINSMITGVGYLFISKSKKARLLKKVAVMLYRIGLRCADSVIFQNDDDYNEFIDNRLVDKRKCNIVNGSGVDMTRFERKPYPERVTFFMLSRIMHAKGVLEYVSAAKIVKERYPDVRFMLLGAFENIQDSIPQDSFTKEYIDSGVVDYFGESSDIPSYYAQSSVYVLPSYREGTPRTVLEAMSMGRAVITTDAPGCRQTVIDGVTGYLVPTKDVNAVVEAMERFIKDSSLVEKMGEESYNYCYSKYRVELINSEMLRIISAN